MVEEDERGGFRGGARRAARSLRSRRSATAADHHRRLATALNEDAFAEVDGVLSRLAADRPWDEHMVRQLRAVGEETLHVLLRDSGDAQGERRLLLIAEGDASRADLEFIAAMDDANLEDRMAMLTEGAAGTPSEEELLLRLLRHYASSVRHQQYHDTDVVAVRVDASPSSRA